MSVENLAESALGHTDRPRKIAAQHRSRGRQDIPLEVGRIDEERLHLVAYTRPLDTAPQRVSFLAVGLSPGRDNMAAGERSVSRSAGA